jgi:xanthine dehydrogenase/oxidase
MAPIAISPERDGQLDTLADLTAKFDDTIRFYLNGTKVVLDEIDPEITVLEYLRGIGLTGTKLYDKGLAFAFRPNRTSLVNSN